MNNPLVHSCDKYQCVLNKKIFIEAIRNYELKRRGIGILLLQMNSPTHFIDQSENFLNSNWVDSVHFTVRMPLSYLRANMELSRV